MKRKENRKINKKETLPGPSVPIPAHLSFTAARPIVPIRSLPGWKYIVSLPVVPTSQVFPQQTVALSGSPAHR
jgi:hypothetical protein